MQYKNDIEELAAMAAHEIKNPLAILRANLQLMQLDDKEKEYQNNFHIMYKQIDKINELVLEFIQLSKPREYYFNKIELTQLLQNVFYITDAIISEKKIELSFHPYCDSLWVWADEERLKQVFINVLKNAVEAMEDEGKIVVTAFRSEGYVSIKFEDTGHGVPEQYLAQVTTPFFTTKTGGSGLGLSISKKIIEDHKGVFVLSSMAERGTAVAITLPEYRSE